MADLMLGFDQLNQRYDLVVGADGKFALDPGYKTAAIAMVLTWGRAREGDPLPVEGDRKGHWADSWAPNGRKWSRIWLMNRRILRPRAVSDAKAYLAEALSPLLERRLVREVVVQTWRSGATRISGRAIIVHLDGAREVVEFDPLIGE